MNAEFQRRARRDKKTFLREQCKEVEENNTLGKLEIFSRKLEIPREHFMQECMIKSKIKFGNDLRTRMMSIDRKISGLSYLA